MVVMDSVGYKQERFTRADHLSIRHNRMVCGACSAKDVLAFLASVQVSPSAPHRVPVSNTSHIEECLEERHGGVLFNGESTFYRVVNRS